MFGVSYSCLCDRLINVNGKEVTWKAVAIGMLSCACGGLYNC